MARDWDKERKAAKNMSVGSCIFGIVFLLVWCAIAPSFMKLFGLIGLAGMIYRLYILIQLGKEVQPKATHRDPWEIPAPQAPASRQDSAFCPWCGRKLEADYVFCPKCGRRVAQET